MITKVMLPHKEIVLVLLENGNVYINLENDTKLEKDLLNIVSAYKYDFSLPVRVKVYCYKK